VTLSANFTSKSVFDQQGCRALTFALARLSCSKHEQMQLINGRIKRAFLLHGIYVETMFLIWWRSVHKWRHSLVHSRRTDAGHWTPDTRHRTHQRNCRPIQ